MKVLIINGPNLNKLGGRDKEHYGSLTTDDIKKKITKEFPSIEFTFFQSNIEGELIDTIQSAGNQYEAIVINPGGYAHTSVSIKDALEDLKLIKIEVHLSNLSGRESYRQNLITASACNGYISGFKEFSYIAAVYLIIKILENK